MSNCEDELLKSVDESCQSNFNTVSIKLQLHVYLGSISVSSS